MKIASLKNFLNRRRVSEIVKDVFSQQDPQKNPECTEFEVNNWILSEFIVEKLYPVVGACPFPVSELLLMTSAVCYFKPTHIFDWGTHIGKSARIFHETSKYFRINAEIHSIDLPEDVEHVEHPHDERGKMVRSIPEVKLHLGDGLTKSLEICKSAEKVKNPLFLLDGDHSYESVYRELGGLIKAIDNPIILIHDTFYQSERSKYNIGPYKAVEKILSENKNKFKVISTNTGLPGMTLIYRNKQSL